jgi:hypothetical protein
MSCGCQAAGAELCGCCTGVTQLTPAVIVNRPALPAINYRVGVYATFLASMQAALSGSNVPALAGLRTRYSSDFSIALIDAWSEVLDILTFYTERLANEAYLGTAIEGRSVFELARLVGYKPSPGVSASTVLAFSLATAPGAPPVVPIAAGTRVQSIPGPGQSPQVFETSAALTATIANNAIPAATSQPWQLIGGDTSTWIAGTSNNIQVGNVLLFLNAPNGDPSPSGPAAVCYVTSVTIDSTRGNTLISWNQPLPSGFQAGQTAVALYIFRTKAALYGANAPVPGMFVTATLQNIPPYHGNAPTAPVDWPFQYTDYSNVINLDNSYAGLSPAASGANAPAGQSQWMVLTGPQYTSFFQIQSASESNPRLYSLSAKTTQLTLASGAVLPGYGDTSLNLNELLWEFVQETRTTTAYVQSQLLSFANLPLTAWPLSGLYPLTAGMLAPVTGDSIVLAGLQPIADNAPIGVNGKRVRIAPLAALTGTGPGVTNPNGGFTPSGATGALAASINQPFLVDAFPPVADPNISGNLLWTVLTVTGQPGTLSMPSAAGAFQLQPSVTTDPATGEAAIVFSSAVNGATTALTLTALLQRIYDTPSVNVNANAVVATHGETVMEILGSGDATNAALQFQLKQNPLTYTAAATAGGSQSTLQVRINNLLWNEVPNFLSSAPADRVYVTRPNSGRGPAVQFGDGIEGSRTPTGVSNIQALYRKGIGVAGMVNAGQLSQPLDRPQGVQTVTNPGPATGGADPSTPADAQESAPLPTLTLGRIVSLEDYQNYALGFAGISLALATWTWFGSTRGIFLTLAGEGGTTLDASDQVVVYLMQAFQTYGLPNMRVLPASYVPRNFEIAMQVMVDSPTYDPNAVIPKVWQSLAAAFAFGQHAPGQSVAASQVIQIAQQVPGVIAVNLTAFNWSGAATGIANILGASGPIPPNSSGSNQPTGAQVLLLDPACQGNVVVWS